MSKPDAASIRRYRIQFSLMTFLLLLTAIGVGVGIWMAWIEPVRDQWVAVKQLLEGGAKVETSPSKLPGWMKTVLPTGQTENIESLDLRYSTHSGQGPLKSGELKCLARLPHLKRLNLSHCGLDDRNVAEIANCQSIEQLVVWGNIGVTNDSVESFTNLPNLKVLNVRQTSMTWQSMIELPKMPQLNLIQDFDFQHARNCELEALAELNQTENVICISESDATTIPRVTRLFPNIKYVQVDRCESWWPAITKRFDSNTKLEGITLRMNQETPQEGWWQAIVDSFDADGLNVNGTEFSIYFDRKSLARKLSLTVSEVPIKELERLDKVDGLSKIKECYISKLNSPEFEDLYFLRLLNNLEDLELYDCKSPQRIDLSLLSRKLQQVRFASCSRLTEIVNFVEQPELFSVRITQCPVATIRNVDLYSLVISIPEPQESIVNFEFLKDVQYLREFQLIHCGGLKDLAGIDSIPGLKNLRLSYCSGLRDWSALFRCRELRDVRIDIRADCVDFLPPPDLKFLAQLDNFSFETDLPVNNQAWLDAWGQIVASRKANGR